MTQQLNQLPLRLLDQVLHRSIRQLQPERQGVDEHAEGPLHARPSLQTAQQHGRKHYIVSPADARDDQRPGCMEQCRRTYAKPAGLSTYSHGDLSPQFMGGLPNLAAVPMHLKYPEGSGRLSHLAQLALEKCARVALPGVRQHLRNMIAIRHLIQRRRRLPLQPRYKLGYQYLDGDVIAGDVMELQQRIPLIAVWILRDLQSYQWRLAQIQPLPCRAHQPFDLLSCVQVSLQSDLIDPQLRLAVYDLHRRGQPLPEDRSAQHVVALDRGSNRLDQLAYSFSRGYG